MFRPKIEVGSSKDKKSPPKSVEHVEEASCDDVEPARLAGVHDIKYLEEALLKAERRLNRARSRLEQVEGDLLLAEEPDDIEDLREEQTDAKARKDKAFKEYEKAKSALDAAKAKVAEEARVETEMRAASDAEQKAKLQALFEKAKKGVAEKKKGATIDETRSLSFKKAKVGMKERTTSIEMDGGKPINLEEKPYPELSRPLPLEPDECLAAEVVEETLTDLGPMPRPRKKFKWTPKKAIAVGLICFLVLPVLLYSFVIPRVDVTVKTWYSEGFQNQIAVDAKIINDGTVEVRNLRINVSVLKDVNGVEVFVTELTSEVTSIGMYTEKKFKAIDFHDDQNEKYVLLVQISFEAAGRTIDKSYTHRIADPYMNIYFSDRVSELAL